ncbi:putative lipid II flippase FtsW [Candidatus Peregrinibacteria bacterium CG10_big_fil_rev_8_21_14_0_10_49_24]|nr:MAG: putative lipid II flippase FtsW [Candidatus Peregrinibacteria bacterium CG11_big_fil_rev_8_21_14_0_20_49_14]PIR50501.1 MAG: putative lipid II flippase FtsW [Candidatus Peregrinibacteria bacterium CG10_big_fil_rev_8_21_14_0_10_49_24]PJA67691.1 MAG: putative lipid II flippase FtsW [Candidatus Peregrinibacteria bacterium CG_4_9_14_3_um_filter_49_12]
MFRRIDLLLLGITVGLTLFGLAMIASVSVFESYQITSRLVDQGLREMPSNSFYLLRSFIHMAVGMTAMGITMVIPYRTWEQFALPLFGGTLLLLFAVFLPGLSADYGTASSWIRLGPISLQPSEFLKLTLIFYLAVWLQKREQLIGTWKEGFIPFASVLLLGTILVAMQPDLGSFLVLSSIAVVMFFVAGGNIFHVLLGGSIAAVMGLPIILNKEYVRNRFHAFLSPDDPTIAETIGFQIKQALIAIGSGGAFGVGYGKSIQKFGYLPEVQSDTIFAAMAEELGFLRLLIILGMFSVLIWRGYDIAKQAPDRFGFLVATGITTWIAFQAILNIAVNLALFPLTGITLPLISYGGSSLLANLMAIGILLNISTYSGKSRRTEERRKTRRSVRTS